MKLSSGDQSQVDAREHLPAEVTVFQLKVNASGERFTLLQEM
ncbi:hypothetical protein [Bacillus daqingensis]